MTVMVITAFLIISFALLKCLLITMYPQYLVMVIMSDHCAISVTVCIPAACKNDTGDFSRQHCSKLLWDKADTDGYRTDVCNCLSRIELPLEALQCKECCDESHQGDIEK